MAVGMNLKTHQCGVFVCLFVLAMGHLFTQEGGGRRETDTAVLKQTEEECKHKEPDTRICLEKDPAKHLHLMLCSKCCRCSKQQCCRHRDLQWALGCSPTLGTTKLSDLASRITAKKTTLGHCRCCQCQTPLSSCKNGLGHKSSGSLTVYKRCVSLIPRKVCVLQELTALPWF